MPLLAFFCPSDATTHDTSQPLATVLSLLVEAQAHDCLNQVCVQVEHAHRFEDLARVGGPVGRGNSLRVHVVVVREEQTDT